MHAHYRALSAAAKCVQKGVCELRTTPIWFQACFRGHLGRRRACREREWRRTLELCAVRLQATVRRFLARRRLAALRRLLVQRSALLAKLRPLYDEMFTVPPAGSDDKRRVLLDRLVLRDTVGKGGDVLTANTLSKLCEHTRVPSMQLSAPSTDTPSAPCISTLSELQVSSLS